MLTWDFDFGLFLWLFSNNFPLLLYVMAVLAQDFSHVSAISGLDLPEKIKLSAYYVWYCIVKQKIRTTLCRPNVQDRLNNFASTLQWSLKLTVGSTSLPSHCVHWPWSLRWYPVQGVLHRIWGKWEEQGEEDVHPRWWGEVIGHKVELHAGKFYWSNQHSTAVTIV